ncbi:hypothetical protein GW17_00030449 [Ensete ventricosum]|nr:hypothetical protein GW17_00030449 [Ensete ventricosum]
MPSPCCGDLCNLVRCEAEAGEIYKGIEAEGAGTGEIYRPRGGGKDSDKKGRKEAGRPPSRKRRCLALLRVVMMGPRSVRLPKHAKVNVVGEGGIGGRKGSQGVGVQVKPSSSYSREAEGWETR